MALEIFVRRRRSAKRPPKTDSKSDSKAESREKHDPSENNASPEPTKREDRPANDNDTAWPFIPFPDGW